MAYKKGICASEQRTLRKMFDRGVPAAQASKRMRVVLECIKNFYAAFADPNILKNKKAVADKIHAQNKLKRAEAQQARADANNAEAQSELNLAEAAEKTTTPVTTKPETIAPPITGEDTDPLPGTPEWDALPPGKKSSITKRRKAAIKSQPVKDILA